MQSRKKSTLKANLDQQEKVLQSHIFNQKKKRKKQTNKKIKNKITKQKTKSLIMFLTLHFAVLSTTQGPLKPI